MAKCSTCGRTRCICNRAHQVESRLGPADPVPGLPEVVPYGKGVRPAPYKPGANGLLHYHTHKGCLNGCTKCLRPDWDVRLAKAKKAVDGEAYNKFGSEH